MAIYYEVKIWNEAAEPCARYLKIGPGLRSKAASLANRPGASDRELGSREFAA